MPLPSDQMLRYRPWRGAFRPPAAAPLAMARAALRLMARQKLFWALYALAILVFLFFFNGQYLVVWIKTKAEGETILVGNLSLRLGDMLRFLDRFHLDGTPHTFGNFVWFEGYVAVIVLALAGAVLVGNDFHFGSLPFYLAKPIARRHYVLGKCLGVAVVVNLLTTLPALLLYAQAGLLYDWRTYFPDNLGLLAGILAYGAVLTVVLGTLLVATAVRVRRTVPLVTAWSGAIVLGRTIGGFLVDGQQYPAQWRLVDLWNDTYLVGLWCLGADRSPKVVGGEQPAVWEAALVLAGLVAACQLYLRNRIRAVEVVG